MTQALTCAVLYHLLLLLVGEQRFLADGRERRAGPDGPHSRWRHSVIPLRPHVPSVDVSSGIKRKRLQNERLADRYALHSLIPLAV